MKRPKLTPAALHDGRYGRPYATLEIDQLWCGRREVWTATHGHAGSYHVMVDGGVAACRPKQEGWGHRSVLLICGDTIVPIGQVPSHMCCRRNGCRQIFDAFLARAGKVAKC
jgi:hypothetical protein